MSSMIYYSIYILLILSVESKQRLSKYRNGEYETHRYSANYDVMGYEITAQDWNDHSLWDSQKLVQYEQKCFDLSFNKKACFCKSNENHTPFKCDAVQHHKHHSHHLQTHAAHMHAKHDSYYNMDAMVPINFRLNTRYPLKDEVINVEMDNAKTIKDLYDMIRDTKISKILGKTVQAFGYTPEDKIYKVNDAPFVLFFKPNPAGSYVQLKETRKPGKPPIKTLAEAGLTDHSLVEMGGNRGATTVHHLLNRCLIQLLTSDQGIKGSVRTYAKLAFDKYWADYERTWGYSRHDFSTNINAFTTSVSSEAQRSHAEGHPVLGALGLRSAAGLAKITNLGGPPYLMYDPNKNLMDTLKRDFQTAIKNYLQDPNESTFKKLQDQEKVFNRQSVGAGIGGLAVRPYLDAEAALASHKYQLVNWVNFKTFARQVYDMIGEIPAKMKFFADENKKLNQ